MTTWLESLAKARDGLLTLIAMIYGTGIAIWSIYAHDAQIGIVPVIDTRYFIAGVAPVSLALLFYFLVRNRLANIRRAADWINARRGIAILVFFAIGAAYFTSLYWAVKYARELGDVDLARTQSALPPLMAISVMTIAIPMVLFMMHLGPYGRMEQRSAVLRVAHRFLVANAAYGMTVLSVLFITVLYARGILPRIPPQLGGARPLNACVELDGSLPSVPATDASSVIRLRAQVLYENDRMVVITLLGDQAELRHHVPRDRIRLLTVQPLPRAPAVPAATPLAPASTC